MAVTITPADVSGGSLPHEFSRLFVIGVSPWRRPRRLAGRAANHAVSDGLAFLPPGTPTNNLDDTSTSPTSCADPTLPPPDVDREWSAGSQLAEALGDARWTPGRRSPEPSTRSAGSHRRSSSATWAGTLGYFADQLLHPIVDDASLDQARDSATPNRSGRSERSAWATSRSACCR